MFNGNEQKENPQGELEARIVELERLVNQKEEELRLANARISEMEQAVANRDGEVVALKDSLAQAVASYRALVVKSNPPVFEQFITGETIDEINKSVERAKSLISKVREGLEAEIVAARVPAGAPQRTPPDLSTLSPREKIQYAIGGKR